MMMQKDMYFTVESCVSSIIVNALDLEVAAAY